MPLHSSKFQNYLAVTGDRQMIALFFQRAADLNHAGYPAKFTLHAFVPVPGYVFRGVLGTEEAERYPGDRNWDGWTAKNWGCRWDCQVVSLDPEAGKARLETVGGPPNRAIAAMSRQFPDLVFLNEWLEEQIEGAGIFEVKAGEVLQEREARRQDWEKKDPDNLIHQLNLKLDREGYSCELFENSWDKSFPSDFYLDLI